MLHVGNERVPLCSGLSRRSFLQATAASAIAAPYIVPSSAFGANERVLTGHIGLGGQGRGTSPRRCDLKNPVRSIM